MLAVGRTPWSAAGPLAGLQRFAHSERPTRSSAVDQGVRPISVNLRIDPILDSSYAGL